MRYLTVTDVVRVNESRVGPHNLADFGLLESAVLRPQTSVFGSDAYPSIHEKAAAFFHSLIRNHAFVDGNKRTAVIAVYVFYRMNGWQLRAADIDIVNLALEVAEGSLDVPELANRFKDSVSELNLPDE